MRAVVGLVAMATATSACGFDARVLSAIAGPGADAATEGGVIALIDGGAAEGGADDGAATDGAAPEASPEAGDRGRAIGVFAGQYFTCALVDGAGFCFGANVNGALGTGDGQTHLAPAPLATTVGFDLLTGGENHTCGLQHGTGAVLCWGYNASGQLGRATSRRERCRPAYRSPVRPSPSLPATITPARSASTGRCGAGGTTPRASSD